MSTQLIAELESKLKAEQTKSAQIQAELDTKTAEYSEKTTKLEQQSKSTFLMFLMLETGIKVPEGLLFV